MADGCRPHFGERSEEAAIEPRKSSCRARTGHAPENCSTLRKIALMLLRRNAIGGMGVGPMRKECAWDFSSAKRVFLGGEGEEAAA